MTAMAQNIEIKARVPDLAVVEARARSVADQGPFDLAQDDTFFACSNGRLKLRELAPDHGEVIFYQRPDISGPKLSQYFISPTLSPSVLRDTLARALGVVGRVRKRRRLYLAENTRIHLDQVEGLGAFLELEVVLSRTQSIADGEAVAHRLMSLLGISNADLEPVAYVDLLSAPQNVAAPFLTGCAPVFLVDDVRAAVEYYVSVFGFKQDFLWSDPPTYGGVSRDGVTLHFAKADQPGRPNSARAAGTTTRADLNVFVHGIHDLYRELVGRGAQIDGPPVQQPYGMTNFHVDDRNGYRLCLGQATATITSSEAA